MFDIGFLEILVILVIALIVIGPERMPEVARKIGSFTGKVRNFVNSVKQDNQVQQTMNELKESMDLEAQQKQMTSIQEELNKGLNMGLDGMDHETFHRPFGGGAVEDMNEIQSGSQFNKAPSQPTSNQTAESKPAQPATPQPAENTASPAPQKATPAAPVETQTTEAKPTATTSEKQS